MQGGLALPCEDCERRCPDILPQSDLAYSVYVAVRGCRNADYLDFNFLFSYMDMMEISRTLQIETFGIIRSIENDFHRRQNAKIHKDQKK